MNPFKAIANIYMSIYNYMDKKQNMGVLIKHCVLISAIILIIGTILCFIDCNIGGITVLLGLAPLGFIAVIAIFNIMNE